MECCRGAPPLDVRNFPPARDCSVPPLLTPEEWKLSTVLTSEAAEAQRQVAEHLHAESVRIKDEADELTRRAHSDVDWGFKQRLAEIQHWRDELNLKFAEISNEVDAQLIYRKRLESALASFGSILDIDAKVLDLRGCRVGVDLVNDCPQQNLLKEVAIIEGIMQVVGSTVGCTTEQVRLLRKTAFNLDKNLRDKDQALEIDKFAHSLNVHRSEVQAQCLGHLVLNSECDIRELDWEEFALRNNMVAQKATDAGIQLRTRIDSLLRQATEDIQKQICRTNFAFQARIKELIAVKEKLQAQHSDISINIREMESVICSMDKSFEEKKSAVALAETRLTIRDRRPCLELVKDSVQRGLILEVHRLNESMAKLNTKSLQAKNALRNLLRNQLELEDAINVKMNTIGIDEAKVMVLRNSIHVTEH